MLGMWAVANDGLLLFASMAGWAGSIGREEVKMDATESRFG